MTQRERVVAGVGGIGFSVLIAASGIVGKVPGGTYSASDVADYVAKGHRTSIFIATAFGLLSALGLLLLLVGLRERIGGSSFLSDLFWGTSLVSVTAFAIGVVAWFVVPISIAIGGSSSVVIDPTVTYVILQVGGTIMFGVGAVFLGLTLIVLMIGSRQTLPAWLRWFTLIAGVLGLASMAYFPFFAVLLWGLITGLWLATAGRCDVPAGEPQPASSL